MQSAFSTAAFHSGVAPANATPWWLGWSNGKLTVLSVGWKTGTASRSTSLTSSATACGLRPRYEVMISGLLAARRASEMRLTAVAQVRGASVECARGEGEEGGSDAPFLLSGLSSIGDQISCARTSAIKLGSTCSSVASRWPHT